MRTIQHFSFPLFVEGARNFFNGKNDGFSENSTREGLKVGFDPSIFAQTCCDRLIGDTVRYLFPTEDIEFGTLNGMAYLVSFLVMHMCSHDINEYHYDEQKFGVSCEKGNLLLTLHKMSNQATHSLKMVLNTDGTFAIHLEGYSAYRDYYSADVEGYIEFERLKSVKKSVLDIPNPYFNPAKLWNLDISLFKQKTAIPV